MPKGNSWDVEIAAAGRWNSSTAGWVTITTDHLKQIAANFNSLRDRVKPMLKLGHNSKQPLIKADDGHPALGWADNVRVQGDKLIATFRDVPDVLYNAIKSKRYSRVSVELEKGVTVSGKKYDYVLTAVGLLGADIPAINSLSDLQTYMSQDTLDGEQIVFTDFQKETNMSDDITKLTQRLEKLETEISSTKNDNVELTQQVTALTKERDDLLAEKKASANEKAKADFTASVDKLVQDKSITPAQRDGMIEMYTDDNAELLTKQLAVFTIGKKAETPPAGEQGHQDNTVDDGGKLPSEKVAQLSQKRASELKISFSAAMDQVLSEDPKLAAEYVAENDGGAS